MSAVAKAHLPPIRHSASAILCIGDATPMERIHIIHDVRQKFADKRGLGTFTLQQAVGLHLASRSDFTNAQMIELEDTARHEDDRLACLPKGPATDAKCASLSPPPSVSAVPDLIHNESLPHHFLEVGCHDFLFGSKLRLGSDPTYIESKIKNTP